MRLAFALALVLIAAPAAAQKPDAAAIEAGVLSGKLILADIDAALKQLTRGQRDRVLRKALIAPDPIVQREALRYIIGSGRPFQVLAYSTGTNPRSLMYQMQIRVTQFDDVSGGFTATTARFKDKPITGSVGGGRLVLATCECQYDLKLDRAGGMSGVAAQCPAFQQGDGEAVF